MRGISGIRSRSHLRAKRITCRDRVDRVRDGKVFATVGAVDLLEELCCPVGRAVEVSPGLTCEVGVMGAFDPRSTPSSPSLIM